mmetsp:Transcript_15420/g.42466  ORF Transcript_15420/g.42466 Transcript_15420/m.42466 type:complete len:203 (+) Transcript_15420:384-992(+)
MPEAEMLYTICPLFRGYQTHQVPLKSANAPSDASSSPFSSASFGSSFLGRSSGPPPSNASVYSRRRSANQASQSSDPKSGSAHQQVAHHHSLSCVSGACKPSQVSVPQEWQRGLPWLGRWQKPQCLRPFCDCHAGQRLSLQSMHLGGQTLVGGCLEPLLKPNPRPVECCLLARRHVGRASGRPLRPSPREWPMPRTRPMPMP